MMNSLSVFEFERQEIRFVDGLPLANDVASILGYADPSKTISTKVFPQNKGVTKMVTPGGIQSVTVLKEAGIYQLIFSSKMPFAQQFQQWVFEEVLPAIRKTGSYSIADHTLDLNPLLDKTLEIVKQSLELSPIRGELKGQILLQVAGSVNPLMKPHLEIARQQLVQETATEDRLLTASEIGKQLGGISAQKVNKLLIEKGFQIKNPNKKSSKDASYVPTDRGSEFADFTQTATGNGSTFQQLRWYESVMSQL